MTVLSKKIDFVEASSPISKPITKFGGHPVWLSQAETPTSRLTKVPMHFICQVLIPKDWYSGNELRMAYVFMTDAGFDDRASETWDPTFGETAVIVQSGRPENAVVGLYPKLLTRSDWSTDHRNLVECEYNVTEQAHQEPDYVNQDTFYDEWTEAQQVDYEEAVKGNKIGGNPSWVQAEQFPFEPWRLLLQLEDGSYPFDFNLGTGIGYVFLNHACTEGALLWQC
jgi:hypothetical protein